MSGRFMTKIDIAAARREQEIFNSMVKRGEIDTSQFKRTAYVVCGCGVEGCGFITRWTVSDNKEVDKNSQ